MATASYSFDYEVYDSFSALPDADRSLFESAAAATAHAYAPYSQFHVGAAARLANGEMISGGNQENAAFPAGLCAEGVVMAAAAAQYPNVPVQSIAITYQSDKLSSDHSIAPCGICRQSMEELSRRTGQPIRLIMGGQKGKIIVLHDAVSLMPLAFRF